MAQPDHSSFYVTGGTLRQDAACYVERQADKDLLEGLLQGEFCYVLTSRQMGKSSLMVRTAGKLREQGVQVVVLDLTAIGQNLTPEQWYDGLLVRLGRQLDLEDELEEFWETHRQLGPCQRLFAALRDVVLGKLADKKEREGDDSPTPQLSTFNFQPSTAAARLVLFVDELDVVRSLPFSTDEFFAAIRECYNRRTEDAECNRLTFCLLGVATPSGLIRDTRTTPFNIGQRIVLNDFTPEEAAPLAIGLVSPKSKVRSPKSPTETEADSKLETRNSELLLDRILHWTNGHPYLTQRLCQAVAGRSSRREESHSDESAISQSLADEFCADLFFSPRAREQDDNLLFVRERLLRSDADLATLLHFYEQVLARNRVPDDETNPLVSVLRLSGIVRSQSGQLVERNQIYERVFDREWIRANMPDAEVRRQREAYRRGLVRAGIVAGVIVTVISTLLFYARRQTMVARRNLYGADMNLAMQAYSEGNLGRVLELLEKHRPGLAQPDLREWEWRYLWHQTRSDELFTLGSHSNIVTSVAFSPDGKAVASGSWDHSVKIWDVIGRREIRKLGHSSAVRGVCYLSDGGQLAAACLEGKLTIWDTATWSVIQVLTNGRIQSFACAPRLGLAAAAQLKSITLWDLNARQVVKQWPIDITDTINPIGLAFSPDEKLLAFHRGAGEIVLWDTATQREIGSLLGHAGEVLALAFSPDGQILASGEWDKITRVWDVATRRERTNLTAFSSFVWCLRFSQDGRLLAAASADQMIRLWETSGWGEIATLRGHSNEVWSVAFSPDGSRLVSGGKDDSVRVWSATGHARGKAEVRRFSSPLVSQTLFSPDGTVLVTTPTGASNSTHGFWRTDQWKEMPVLNQLPEKATAVAISPGGRIVAMVGAGDELLLWSPAGDQPPATLSPAGARIRRATFSFDSQNAAVGRSGGHIELWNVAGKRLLAQLDGEVDDFQPFVISPDGRTLAASGGNGILTLWNLEPAKRLAFFRAHKRDIYGVAFSPSSQLLASASDDGTVKLWRIGSQQPLTILSGHLNAFSSVAFSGDNRRLAAGTADGSILLWDLATDPPQEVGRLKAHTAWAFGLSFLPDNETLISVTSTEIRAWRGAPFTGGHSTYRQLPSR